MVSLRRTLTASASAPTAAVLLNHLPVNVAMMKRVFAGSQLVVAADGGANQLHDGLPRRLRFKLVPDVIVGDMDSLRPDVRRFYEALGCPIIRIADQNTCDLQKAVTYVERYAAGTTPGVKWGVAVCASLAGRYDHTVQTINALFQPAGRFAEVCVLSPSTSCRLLRPGTTTRVELHPVVERTRGCGLLPVAGPVSVTTRGLQWECTGVTLQYGAVISSSNHMRADVAEVTVADASAPVLWTTQLTWEAPP